MGLDAKGRNFSAPRLTPGKGVETMVYGSPNMLKDQERKIAIMDSRMRRYSYSATNTMNASVLGSSNRTTVNATRNYSNAALRSASPQSSPGLDNFTKVLVIGFLLLFFSPILLGIGAVIIDVLSW